METERTPLRNRNVPRYTFLGSGNPPKQTARRFQCCILALSIMLLLMTLAIIIWYYVSPAFYGKMSSNSSQTLDDLLRAKWPLPEEKYSDLSVELNDEKRAFDIGVDGLKEKDNIEDLLPSVPMDSPIFLHQIATHTSKEAQHMSRLGYILNMGAKEINRCLNLSSSMNQNWNKPRRWGFTQSKGWHPAEGLGNNTLDCRLSSYRTADGTCNNLKSRNWGAALRPFRRIILPKYEDNISEPRLASDGSTLQSARDVSLAIHRPVYRNDVNFTVMLAVWGQFIDHDITATAISRGKNGTVIKCCQTRPTHPECFPVLLSPSDPFYLQCNITCMEFVRSAPAPTSHFGPREQLNQVTSFLDGSVVYGNDDAVMNKLRTFTGGELKMLKTSFGDLLPISEDLADGCNRKKEFQRGRYCFLSGDERSNENVLLTSMHLLLARQHNLIAKVLSRVNPHWTDEKLFQETKKIVAAQIQHITYTEFLPSILPDELISRLNMSTRRSGYSDLYSPSVDPSVANVFASAAFRFGHTLLPGVIRISQNSSSKEEFLELHKMLFDPFKLFEREFLEDFIKGAMNTSSEKSDVYFSDEVTHKLFQKNRKCPYKLDLVSLNIQRGRDHGLPPYPNWRTICGLRRPENFDDLREEFDEETLERLKKLYKSVDDLDLYTGGLAEKPVKGGMVGPTISCLLADQFLRLKIGDRFWYETGEEPQRFTQEQLNEIRKTSLAEIICKTSGVQRAQPSVMRRVGINNEMLPCSKFSAPNFAAWKEI